MGMMNARIATALFLTAALAAPTGAATFLLPVETPPALDAWGLAPTRMGEPSASASTDLALDVQRRALTLGAAGDINADGVDDLILQSVDLNNGFTLVQAVSGASLDAGADAATAFQKTIWQLAPNQGSVLGLVGDLDGDGVADMVISQAISQGAAEMQSTAEASYGTVEAQGAILFQALDGATASGSFGVELATSFQSQAAGLAELGLQKASQTTGHVQPTGTGALHQIETQVESAQASLLQDLPLDALTSVEADAVITVLDATGNVRGQIALEEPGVNPLQIAAPDLDMDGLTDTVLLEVQKAGPAQEASALVPTVTSYTGAAVDMAWETQLDPFSGLPLLVPDVGDLNGDGHVELAFHAISQVPGNDPSGTVLTILDGASGEVMAQTESAEGLLMAAPLGGSVNGDATADVLLLEGTASAITSVSVATESLEMLWTVPIPDNAVPLNLIRDPFTDAAQGLTDLTGDGVPDLAVANGVTAGPLASDLSATLADEELVIEVFGGVDGETVWSKTLPSVLAIREIAGGAAGGSASAIAVIEGASTDTLDSGLHTVSGTSLLLLRATDGAEIFRLPLLEADVIEQLSASGDFALTASIEAAGDVDADGVTDLAVRVESVLAHAASVPVHQIQSQLVAATDMAVDQVHLVSGASGEVLQSDLETSNAVRAQHTTSGNSSQVEADAELQATMAPGDVEELEAYGTDSVGGDEVGAPSVGVVTLLVAIALLGALRRRN